MKSLARTTVIALGFLLGAAESLVLAAPPALQPVREIKDASSIWQWIGFALMIGVCVAVAFKNSKRSHQG